MKIVIDRLETAMKVSDQMREVINYLCYSKNVNGRCKI